MPSLGNPIDGHVLVVDDGVGIGLCGWGQGSPARAEERGLAGHPQGH